MKQEVIQVAVRCRPLNQRELQGRGGDVRQDASGSTGNATTTCMECRGNKILIEDPKSGHKRKEFTFDKVFWSTSETHPSYASQKDVFDDFGASLVDSALEGYNTCIFAYGQTGSGKSYSMVGSDTDEEHKGLLPRLLRKLFEKSGDDGTESQTTSTVDVSMIEIYNERVYDLLDPHILQNTKGRHHSQSLKVRIHPKTGAYVENLKLLGAASITEALRLIELGSKARTIHATNMNATSSRAHTVFTINLSQRKMKGKEKIEVVSKINLVDLAGSERTNKTGTTGQRLKEGTSINKSLSALGKCISALAELSSNAGKKERLHIPYRESTLTLILRESLGGNSRTGMLATISPSEKNLEETLSTLRFASRTKRIVNKAEVNIDPNKNLVLELREEIKLLKEALHETSTNVSSQNSSLADQLRQNQSIVDKLSHSWEDRHQETLTQLNLAKQNMRAMGLLHSFESSVKNQQQVASLHMPDPGGASDMLMRKASLINLNVDPMLSGQLVFHILPGETKIGSMSHNDCAHFILSGLKVQPEHGVLHCTHGLDGSISLEVQACSEKVAIHVNGEKLSSTVAKKIHHNDRIIFGAYSAYRVDCISSQGSATTKSGEEIGEIDWNFAFREYSKTQMDSLIVAKENELEKKYREMFERKLEESNAHIELALEKQCQSLVELQENISSKETSQVQVLMDQFETLKDQHQRIQNDLRVYQEDNAAVLSSSESVSRAFPDMRTPKKKSWRSTQEAKSKMVLEIEERILAVKEAMAGQKDSSDSDKKQTSEVVEKELSAFVEKSLQAMEEWHKIRRQESIVLSVVSEEEKEPEADLIGGARENLELKFEESDAKPSGDSSSQSQKLVEELLRDIVDGSLSNDDVSKKNSTERKEHNLSDQFCQELTECIVLVDSTNEIVNEVNEKLRFKIRLATNLPDFDQAPAPVVDANPSTNNNEEEHLIVVDAYYGDSHIGVYSASLFEEKSAAIEQMYMEKNEEQDSKTLMQLHDCILEDLPMDRFIGASYIYLKPLLYLLETDGKAHILDEHGYTCGDLAVRISPSYLLSGDSNAILDMDILDCRELLGKKLEISVESDKLDATSNALSGLDVFADYRILFSSSDSDSDLEQQQQEDGQEDHQCERETLDAPSPSEDKLEREEGLVVSKTNRPHQFHMGLMTGSSCYFQYHKTHTFGCMTEEVLDYFESGAVRINVYGRNTEDKALIARELKKLRLELTPEEYLEEEEEEEGASDHLARKGKVAMEDWEWEHEQGDHGEELSGTEDDEDEDVLLPQPQQVNQPPLTAAAAGSEVLGIPSPLAVGSLFQDEHRKQGASSASKGCSCTIM